MDPIITARLNLRPAETGDRGHLLELFGNEQVMRAFSGPVTGAEAEERFARMVDLGKNLRCAEQPMFELEGGDFVGYAGLAWYTFTQTELALFDADEQKRFAGRQLELKFAVMPDKQGQGFATEAGRALVECWKAAFGGDLLARVERWNEDAQTLVERIGFSDVVKRYQVTGGDLTFVYLMEAPVTEASLPIEED